MRIGSLDSLRGLAALSVVIFHVLYTFESSKPIVQHEQAAESSGLALALFHSPLTMLWAGHEAVLFFFVLSGFVLALPYYTGRSEPYRAYIVRRVLRIYPPYLVVGVLAVALIVVLHPGGVASASQWFNDLWNRPLSASTVGLYVFMTGLQTERIDSVTWSLVHEMRISFLLPFIALLAARLRWQLMLVIAVAFSVLALGLGNVAYRSITGDAFVVVDNLLHTLHYLGFFMLGALLAWHRNGVIRTLATWNWWRKAALLAAASGLYTLQSYTSLREIWLIVPEEVLIDWAAALGACVFIMLTLSSRPVEALLSKRGFAWLGRTSYSLYLAHLVVLLAVVHLLTAWVPLGVAVVPALVMAFAVAGLTHRLVEVPSIKLGRYLAARVKPTAEPHVPKVRPVPSPVAAGQSSMS